MCGKILFGVIILIAIAMGVLATIAGHLADHWLAVVGVAARFFDVMLPILGVGALLKYLCTCSHKGHCGNCGNCGHCGHDHDEVKK